MFAMNTISTISIYYIHIFIKKFKQRKSNNSAPYFSEISYDMHRVLDGSNF